MFEFKPYSNKPVCVFIKMIYIFIIKCASLQFFKHFGLIYIHTVCLIAMYIIFLY